MSVTDEEVPNKFLLEEIRLNRTAIEEGSLRMHEKVGRRELIGWLGAVIVLTSLASLLGV